MVRPVAPRKIPATGQYNIPAKYTDTVKIVVSTLVHLIIAPYEIRSYITAAVDTAS
jgi:hypothetical protein